MRKPIPVEKYVRWQLVVNGAPKGKPQVVRDSLERAAKQIMQGTGASACVEEYTNGR